MYIRHMVFLTGGTGLLGMRLLYDLLCSGEQVRALYRESSDLSAVREVMDFYHGGSSQDLLSLVEWEQGDIEDIDRMMELLQGCMYCIHAAALVSFHPKDCNEMMEVNIGGTATLVDACLTIPGIRMLYVSSVASLGRITEQATINEKVVWKDSPYNTRYAVSKYHAEMELWRGIEEGLNAVMVNPSIIIGAAPPHRSSGTLYGAVLNGLKWYTDGAAAVVDVRDVSKAGLTLMRSDIQAERFLLASETLPYQKLFAHIAQSLGRPRPNRHATKLLLAIAWRAAWLKDILSGGKSPITRETALSSSSAYTYDCAKVKEELDFSFIPAEEALHYHAAFFKEN